MVAPTAVMRQETAESRSPKNALTPTQAEDKAGNPKNQLKGQGENAVMLQLNKTKMCAFFERGKCASTDCRYAHSASELRPSPNLQKTKICRAFMQGDCQDGENCGFAHGEGDLRVTHGVYKTQMCNFFERGYCKKGDRCNHAHGPPDLRPPAADGQQIIRLPAASSPMSKTPNSHTSTNEGLDSPTVRSNSSVGSITPLPLAELIQNGDVASFDSRFGQIGEAQSPPSGTAASSTAASPTMRAPMATPTHMPPMAMPAEFAAYPMPTALHTQFADPMTSASLAATAALAAVHAGAMHHHHVHHPAMLPPSPAHFWPYPGMANPLSPLIPSLAHHHFAQPGFGSPLAAPGQYYVDDASRHAGSWPSEMDMYGQVQSPLGAAGYGHDLRSPAASMHRPYSCRQTPEKEPVVVDLNQRMATLDGLLMGVRESRLELQGANQATSQPVAPVTAAKDATTPVRVSMSTPPPPGLSGDTASGHSKLERTPTGDVVHQVSLASALISTPPPGIAKSSLTNITTPSMQQKEPAGSRTDAAIYHKV